MNGGNVFTIFIAAVAIFNNIELQNHYFRIELIIFEFEIERSLTHNVLFVCCCFFVIEIIKLIECDR